MGKPQTPKNKSFTKRLDRLLSVILVMMITFMTVPIELLKANAETKYAISIAGVRVTDENAADILGDGKFSYDNGTKTLTVSGDIARTGGNPSPAIESSVPGLIINVAKDSKLTTTGYSACISLNADTTITGKGVLTVEGKLRAIYAQKLRVENATIHAKSTGNDRGSAAFGGPGSLEIVSSDITAENSSELRQAAIADFNDGITLKNCEIITPEDADIAEGEIRDADGKGAHKIIINKVSAKYGLIVAGERVTSENADDVLGNGVFSYDDSTKTLTVNGDYNYNGTNCIIRTFGADDITINVASDSHLTMLAGSGAFYISCNTTITGPGVLTLEAGRVAVEIWREKLTIADTRVNIISRSSDPQ